MGFAALDEIACPLPTFGPMNYFLIMDNQSAQKLAFRLIARNPCTIISGFAELAHFHIIRKRLRPACTVPQAHVSGAARTSCGVVEGLFRGAKGELQLP
jgi:hypothetical protein